MTRLASLLALLAALVCGGAWAQAPTRTVAIPDTAVRGVMSHVSQNVVTVDGQTMQLAPGARIWNRENLTITPAMLPKESLVDFVVDGNRQIFRVWILTAAEAAVPRQGTGYGQLGTPIDRLFGPPPVPSGYGPPPAPRNQ
jgi:predicted YcjX-like family ATPase